MFDVTKINYSSNDLLIFTVNDDLYDVDDFKELFDNIKKDAEANGVKIMLIPTDLVDKIIHIDKYDIHCDSATSTSLLLNKPYNPIDYPQAYYNGTENNL